MTGFSLLELFALMRRRRKAIALIVVLSTAAATLIGLRVSKTYTATAEVLLEPRESRVVDVPWVAQGLPETPAIIETQAKLIRSPAVLGRAAADLGRIADLDLVSGEPDPTREGAAGGNDGWSGLERRAMAASRETPSARVPDVLRDEAIAALQRGLEVTRPSPYVLAISYTSTSPHAAARIANGIAEAYIATQLDGKLEETRRAVRWLTDKVEELRGLVLDSERAVEQYRIANGLNTRLDSQEIAALTTSLIDVRAELATRQARLEHLRGLRAGGQGFEASAEVLASPVILDLRQREIDLAHEEAQLSREYGSNHPRILQLRAEQRKMADRIDLEVDNLVANLENEIAVARSREAALLESLDEAKGESVLTAQAAVNLRELEREADANRTIYETFLTRVKETEQQLGLVQADARLISPAQAPIFPSSAPPRLFAVIGFTASLFVGAVLALLLEQVDTTLRSGRQVESLLDVRALGLVPRFTEPEEGQRLHQQLLDRPGCAFAQGIHELYTRIHIGGRAGPLLMVSSALPGEGKTSLATSLAVLAGQLGRRVLLLDLDLRRPAVHREFAMEFEADVQAVLSGRATVEEAVQHDSASGVDVLGGGDGHGNPITLLTSEPLAKLLRDATERYDDVVIDAPPVLGLPDAKTLSSVADAVVFVVHWNRTKRDAAIAALKDLKDVSANVVGAVLNQVDLDKHASYAYRDGAQYYSKYKKYYVENPSTKTPQRSGLAGFVRWVGQRV